MTDEQNLINEIFEKYLGSDLSIEASQKIADVYGKEIASKVIDIYTDAIDCPVDWRTATIDSALPILHDLLNRKYTWLNAEARKKINYAFLMTWK
jgi:hypothetical protein